MTERGPDKSPDEIEDEIARTRADMDSTLDAIQRKLSPSELADQAMNYVKQSGADEVIGGLGRTMRDNPVPIALIGLGCAWLLFSGVSSRRNGDDRSQDRGAAGLNPYPEAANGDGSGEGRLAAARDGASRAVEAVGGAAHGAAEGLLGAVRAATDRGQQLGDYARGGVGRARSSYDAMVADRPLALGAVGLAVGAAIGLLLPATRQEDEALGGYRDQVFEQAQAAGREQVQKAQKVANEAWRAAKDTVKEEATKQGLVGAPAEEAREQQPKRPRPAGAPAQA